MSQIRTPEGYLSYPNLGKPVENKLDPTKAPRFSTDLIFPKGTDLTELQNAIVATAKEVGIDPSASFLCLKKCSERIDKDTGDIKPLYCEGDYYLKAWAQDTRPPQLVGPQGQINYPATDFRGGNLAAAIINLYGGSVPSKYVNASLMAVQWRGEGKTVEAKANLNLFEDAKVSDMPTNDSAPDTSANPFG